MAGCVKIDSDLCKGCLVCTAFCPKGTLEQSVKANAAGYVPVTSKKDNSCTGCGICALVCAEVAIEVYRD